ncbi:MAG TPA: HAD family hydrolase [Planctomycetaceae bacterium]|jgi:beta-phosphoglucomutase-like phosphatase (HAD superfamily)
MFLPNTRIEVIHSEFPRGRVRAALFDFDGTLSLIREGWPEVMIPMMVDHLAATPTTETRDELGRSVEEFVMRLNGKQTIYQMIQLADEVHKRGGTPREPLEYKHEYHDLLWQRISGRVAALDQGTTAAESLTVPGSRELLEQLTARQCPVYLASGTDLMYVQNEVRALALDQFFGQHIYGAIDDYQNFSKKMVIERLVSQLKLDPGELIGFGDGFVEIQEVKRAGGIAVGVASDEKHRTGINDWKRDRLIQAGADIIVPDYRDLDALLELVGIAKPQA